MTGRTQKIYTGRGDFGAFQGALWTEERAILASRRPVEATLSSTINTAIASLNVHDHACLIYENEAEQRAVTGPFIKIGLERGERCVYIADANTPESVMEQLRSEGVNVDEAVEQGRLAVVTQHETYLREGVFDPKRMIAFLSKSTAEALLSGYSALRATGEMTWAMSGDPGTNRLAEYEALLNGFFPTGACVALCQYDRKRFSPEIMRDVIRTHSIIIHKRHVCRNPYFIPLEEMQSREGSVEREVDRLMAQLHEREMYESALRSSDQRTRCVFEHSPGAMVLIDRDTGRFEEFNAAAHEMLGYAKEEFAELSVADVEAGGTTETWATGTSILYEAEGESVEARLQTRDGRQLDVLVVSRLIELEGRRHVLSNWTDISERKRAEQELRQREELLSAMARMARIGGWEHDLVKREATWTNGTYEIIELESGPPPGPDEHLSYYPEDDRVKISEAYQRSVETGESFDLEVQCNTAKGRRIWTRVIGRPLFEGRKCVKIRGTIQDITERKLAEESRLQSERLLKTTQRLTKVGGWEWDVDGETMTWTEEMFRIHDMDSSDDREALRGLSERSLECYPEEGRDIIWGAFQRCIHDGISYDLEFPFTTKKGRRLWIRTTAEAIRKGDRVVKVVGNLIDITDRKLREQALREAEQRYELAIQASNDGLFDLDAECGQVLYSPRWYTMLGYEPYELPETYETWTMLLHPDQREEVERRIWELINGNEPWDYAFSMRRKDGTYAWIQGRGQCVELTPDGKPKRVVGTHTDISKRKAAEESLREAENRFRMLFENSLSGVALHELITDEAGRPIDYRFLAINDAYEEYTGISSREAIGRRITEVNPGLAEAPFIEVYGRTALTGEPTRFEQYFAQMDRYYDIQVYSPMPRQFATVYKDITEVNRALNALRESEGRYRAVVDYMATGAALYRAVDDGEDFVFVDINPAGAAIGGAPREAHINRRIREVYPSVEKMGIFGALQRVWKTGESEVVPLTQYKDERLSIWVENHISKLPTGEVIAVYEDLTQRKKAEEGLRRERDFARTLVDTAQAIVLVFDLDGRIVHINRYMEELSGYALSEVQGLDWFETFLPREDRAAVRSLYRHSAEEHETQGTINILLTKAGERRAIEWYDKPLRDADDAVTGVLAIGHDVTERLRAESQSKELEEQLRQSQKLEAVGLLAGGVAHDFNNLLTALNGYVEVLEDRIAGDVTALKYVEGIKEAARQAAGVTRSLLTFSSKTPLHKERVDLRSLVAKVARLLKRMMSAAIVIEAEAEGTPIWLHADVTQLQQIIMNLAINARDAMPDGGTLRIMAAEVDEHAAGNPALLASREGAEERRYAQLVVSDSGAGIAPDIRERLFEPFFTTKTRGHGTGLGLSIVHGIVREHGGLVEVDSTPGEGSTFKITLPLDESPAVEAPQAPSQTSVEARGGAVLLADDDWNVRSVIATTLRRNCLTVVEAEDGADLTRQYAEHADELELLIIDVDLPQRNGLDCLAQIRREGGKQPAIIITGGAQEGIESRLDEQTQLLRKPFSMSEIRSLALEQLSKSEARAGR